MHTEHIIRAVAGILTVVGIALALWVNIYWMILPGFVGFNLLQSAFSKFCPLEVFINEFSENKHHLNKQHHPFLRKKMAQKQT